MKTEHSSSCSAARRRVVGRTLGVAFAFCLGGLAPKGHAVSLFWTNVVDGAFADAANWSPSQAPAAGDSTFFTNSASFTVTFAADALNMNSNYFNGKAGTVNLDLGAFAWGLTNGSAIAGRGAFVVGQAAGSTASVVLARGSLVVTNAANTARLVVGGNGIGSFFITNGAVRANLTSLGDTATGRGTLMLSGNGTTYSNSSTLQVGANSYGNSFTVSNGGAIVVSGTTTLGAVPGSSNNSILITGNGSSWSNTTGNLVVGYQGSSNLLTVADKGRLYNNGTLIIGGSGGAAPANNTVLLTDSGSVITNTGGINVGDDGSGAKTVSNSLWVVNGATLYSGQAQIGAGSGGAHHNTAVVAGSNSLWYVNPSSIFYVGSRAGTNNTLVVINGGRVVNNSQMYVGASGAAVNMGVSNRVLVAGSGSVITNTGQVRLGGLSAGKTPGIFNEIAVSNQGMFVSLSTSVLQIQGSSNQVVIADSGSAMSVGSDIELGSSPGAGNTILVSNGAALYMPGKALQIAYGTVAFQNSSNQTVLVTGAETLLQAGSVAVGKTASGYTNNYGGLLVLQGGTLEANSLSVVTNVVGGLAGAISNNGGIYQFTTTNPTITVHAAGAIQLVDGTIGFKGVTNANVFGNRTGSQLTNMLFSGSNTFRLNNASNWTSSSQSYTFGYTATNPSNYAGLEMINGGTAWKSAWLAISNNGSLLVSNTGAAIEGVLTNSGTIRVVNASANFASNVVLNAGSFTFAGATNTFASGLAIASGALLGGSGRVVNNGATNAGTLAPGNSPGTMTFSSNLTLLASSELVLEIGATGLDYDHLVVEGTLTKGGTVLVTNLGYTFVGGEVFDFIDATNRAGSFNLLSLPTLSGGMTWYTSDFETKGMLSVIAVPEPSAAVAAGTGLALLIFFRRRV